MTFRMAHAEDAVHLADFAGGNLCCHAVELVVVWMDDRRYIAERENGVMSLVAEHFIHGSRPVDASARHVPVPQPATAARQCRIDPRLRVLVKLVRILRACGLAEIGIEHDQHDRRRSGEHRDVDRDDPAPVGEDGLDRMHDED